eukprot:GHRQ01008580.1.p2 GENE.GHRQ01008580.1~~GHRQ01008580.1.p2  ORF type:complete len:189 (+),score=60.81 GHRQ01008580.1:856-1422(+)
MLRAYSPAAAELPSSNGDWALGEGIQLGAGLGAALLHMGLVQVHPTGFVDPADPAAGTKWLAPEKLRGCGAILLNSSGRRFVDELATRDEVTAALMTQHDRLAWLLLGAAGSTMFGDGTLHFYGSKGLVQKVRGARFPAGAGVACHRHCQESLSMYVLLQTDPSLAYMPNACKVSLDRCGLHVTAAPR